MTQWYIKAMAELSGVSVRTLHHYDKLGLLTPSIRQNNGYRLYNEADLLRLQQIIALKFFGFSLNQINALLKEPLDVKSHLIMQSKRLEEKANALQQASTVIDAIIDRCDHNHAISWTTIIELIEVYQMTKQLDNQWIADALNKEELKEYIDFEASLKQRYTPQEKTHFERAWKEQVKLIHQSLHLDPTTDQAQRIAASCMNLINTLYGKEYAQLKHTVWEKGFKGGKSNGEHGLSLEHIEWLDCAIDSYYRHRIYSILNAIEQEEKSKTHQMWDDLIVEMCGDSHTLRQDLIQNALNDSKISEQSKQWIQQHEKENR